MAARISLPYIYLDISGVCLSRRSSDIFPRQTRRVLAAQMKFYYARRRMCVQRGWNKLKKFRLNFGTRDEWRRDSFLAASFAV